MGTPSARGQEALLRRAYRDAGVAPARVGYVEAHGTGTRAGDPVELTALGAVLGEGRHTGSRARIGSVKTNFGHTEGAAGVAGLIKVALALHHRRIPSSLHCRTPTPAIDWPSAPFEIARCAVPWTDGGRFGGVSAFGIAGTNAHVVLGEAPAPAPVPARAQPARPAVLALSAGSSAALKALAEAHAARLERAERSEVDAVCWNAATRRAALAHRAVFIADGGADLAAQLRAFAGGADAPWQGVVHAQPAVAPVFIVPGQGGQWPGMARKLLAHEPVFRQALQACEAAARPWLGGSLIEQLMAQPDAPQLERIEWIQPVLLAVSIAYARWLESMGIEASTIIGHSMGEVGAAHLAGALDLPQAMRIICRRSALMGRTSGRGGMAVVELPMAEAERRLAGLENVLSVAVSNSARSCVVSGDAAALQSFMARLQSEGVFCRAVKVDVASHSPQMDDAARDLMHELADVEPKAPTRAMVSTVLARAVAGAELDARHWARNLRQPVRFAEVVQTLLEGGARTFVELGPHPVLTPAVEQNAQAAGAQAIACCTGRREESEQTCLLGALAALWVGGHRVEWSRVLPAAAPTDLPLYPWQRERLWVRQAQQMAGAQGARSATATISSEQQAWLHALRWVAEETPSTGTSQALPVSWSVIGGADALATAASDALRRAGATVRRVTAAALPASDVAACDAVLCFVDDTPHAGFVPVQVVQALARARTERPHAATPKLWIVTSGAQAVEDAARPRVAVRAAEAWGAGRVIADEHPDLWGGLVDLDPIATPQDNAAWLLQALTHGGPAQSALRDGRRYVLRLQPLSAEAVEPAPIAWRPDSTYLISGGLGALGLQVAASLVAQGVRRLVLMGRHGLPPRASWSSGNFDERTAQRIAAVCALERAGAAVHVMEVDVADGPAVSRALQAFADEAWPPIRGVLHAAGVLRNRLALELDAATYREALAPKLDGAVHLERHLPDLEHLVLFSSISAVFGLPGMANYAAANAGLDALAADRRARGLPALSLQWGPWHGVGMHSGEVAERNMQDLRRQGVQDLEASAGLALLQALAGRTDTASLCVMPIDWAQLVAARRGRDISLFAARAPASAAAASDVAERLAQATPRERRAWMEPIVRNAVAQVLKLSAARIDVRKPFGSMGLTSLLAMELRNRLEAALARPLSATLAFNYPTVDALVGFLCGEQPAAAVPAPAQREPAVARAAHEDITSLSDDEAAQLLRRQR
jgi:acyl transferase domain-containing protein